VVRFLEAIPSLKSRTALTTVYAAGSRRDTQSTPFVFCSGRATLHLPTRLREERFLIGARGGPHLK
jgi:hypothetical protein